MMEVKKMATNLRAWIEQQDDGDHGVLGNALLSHVKTTLATRRDRVAERLAHKLRPLVNDGDRVYLDEIKEQLTRDEQKLFCHFGYEAALGMRVAIGPYQLVHILELAEGE